VTQPRHVVRRVDWRFLLHDARLGTVAAFGAEPDEALIDSLRQLGATLVDPESSPERVADVVFADDPGDDALRRALAFRSTDGTIVVQTTSRLARRRVGNRMRRAGLSVTHYGCWPRCVDATRFVPLHDRAQLVASARAAKNRRRRALGLLLARVGLGSVVFGQATSIATAADRPDAPAPLRVAFGDGDGAGGTMTLLTPRFGTSRHVIAMTTDGRGQPRVVKTPRLPGDDDQLNLEARGLTSISGREPARPELVADAERFGQRWLVQTTISGPPLSRRHIVDDADRWLAAANAWLQHMPTAGCTAPNADGRADRLLHPAFDVLVASSDREPELRPLVADAERAIERIADIALPVRAEHGDFRPPNLIITGPGAVAAVDWELAERNGFPLYDLVFFHAFVADVTPGLRPKLRRLAAEALRSEGIDPELLATLTTMAALRQLANLVARRPDGEITSAVTSAAALAHSDVARSWSAELNDRLQNEVGE
jgi:Phosphotransferase enzyme family